MHVYIFGYTMYDYILLACQIDCMGLLHFGTGFPMGTGGSENPILNFALGKGKRTL